MTTFGPAWSRALCVGCASLNVPPEWVLAVLALESGFNPFARNPSGAFGLCQQMPRDGVPYRETNPVRQLEDAFKFWRAMVRQFAIAGFPSRAVFYALNLAPARLRGSPTDETVLYSLRQDLHPKEFWPNGYRQNAVLARIVGHDATGAPIRREWIAIGDLEPGLARYVARNQARYDAELEAAMVANVSGPPDAA